MGGEARLGRELRLRRVAQRRLDRAVLQAQWWVVRHMVLWTVGHAVGTGGEGWTRLGEKHASGVRSISIASLGAASTAPSCKHSGGLCTAHGPVHCGPRCVERGALVRRGTGGSGASLEAMLSPLARLAKPAKRPQGPCEIPQAVPVSVERCKEQRPHAARGVRADACAGGWRRVRPRAARAVEGGGLGRHLGAPRLARHARPFCAPTPCWQFSERLTRG